MPIKDPEARRQYRAKWHAENYNGERAVAKRLDSKVRRKQGQEFVRSYKAERGCSRCPERDVACLDMHHPEGTKEAGISHAAVNGWSKRRLLAEMEKCEVLCANCHRKHHASIA